MQLRNLGLTNFVCRVYSTKSKTFTAMKKSIFIHLSAIALLIVLTNQVGYAQLPNLEWARTFGGSNIDIGHHVEQTSDLGFIITGYTRSFGAAAGRNVWLVKTDNLGYQEWQVAFGGADDDEGHSVKQTTDGGFIIAGHTESFGAGLKDVLLIRTDANGNQMWMRTFGGTSDDEGYDLLQTSDGGFLIAGVSTSFTAGSRDGWLVKTDALGNQQWTKSFGGWGSDGFWSIVQTADGGYALAGWTFSLGPGPLGNAWLVKVDVSGNLQWQKAFGGTDVDRAYDVDQLDDEGFILTGFTYVSTARLDDMWLIRTDNLGNALWTKTFGGTGRDYGNAVKQTADGGLIVAGYTLSFGMGSEDFWFVRTDIDGNLLWQTTLGGGASDVAFSVQQTLDGGFVATGHTLSHGAGVHDVWLVKLAADVTSVPYFTEPSNNQLRNFPNPFKTTTNISFTLQQPDFITLEVLDLTGRVLRTLLYGYQNAGTHQVTFDANGLSDGIYLYRLHGEGIVETHRMILLE